MVRMLLILKAKHWYRSLWWPSCLPFWTTLDSTLLALRFGQGGAKEDKEKGDYGLPFSNPLTTAHLIKSEGAPHAL